MAKLTDLPAEIRLWIFGLLLDDPIKQGQRITFTVDRDNHGQTTRGSNRCIQTQSSHSPGHSIHPCNLNVDPYTLHYLNFKDLMSLAGVDRLFYFQACQYLYNNMDMTYVFGQPSCSGQTTDLISGCAPFYLFLDQHGPPDREMVLSLSIHDPLGTLSSRDMNFIVDLINTRLPGLRLLGIKTVGPSSAGSLQGQIRDFSSKLYQVARYVRPLARLQRHTEVFLDMPFQMNAMTNILPQEFTISEISVFSLFLAVTVKYKDRRRLLQRGHGLALGEGSYLLATFRLRSDSDAVRPPDMEIAKIEHGLHFAHSIGCGMWNCRYWFEALQRYVKSHC